MATVAAIDLPVGKLDVDSNGQSQYALSIRVPSGIGTGNEPDLSLQYAQALPNGPLGTGWALGGLSSIQRAPSTLAVDGINDPTSYNPFEQRLALDGTELLNISGVYWAADAVYSTELSSANKQVKPQGTGFVVTDASGRQWEYGTTADSCVSASDGTTVLEWHLKRALDFHGNYILYTYVSSPQTAGNSVSDSGMCYIDNICYTSNLNGYQGCRYVFFDYISRNDTVVRTVVGGQSICASLLSAIRVSVVVNSTTTDLWAYQLEYTASEVTGTSCLTSITEKSLQSDGTTLTPTSFQYSGGQVAQASLFQPDPTATTTIGASGGLTQCITFEPMDISGRALTDLACIMYEPATEYLYIETYLATPRASLVDGEIALDWNMSTYNGGTASLPQLDPATVNSSLNFLSADVNGDGRMDLILPYKDPDSLISFSISESIGTGFAPWQQKPTGILWTDESAFMALDLNGNGRTDIVQIYSAAGTLAFRCFLAIDSGGSATLSDAIESATEYDFAGTTQWLVANSLRNGAAYLVRIWTTEEMGQYIFKATTFLLQGSASGDSGFSALMTSTLGSFQTEDVSNLSLIVCDANGDGVQDIVSCLESRNDGNGQTNLNFQFTTFLSDGVGGFKQQSDPVTRTYSMPTSAAPQLGSGTWQATNLYGSTYTDLTYVYLERDSHDLVCLAVEGACSATLRPLDEFTIASASKIPSGNVQVCPVDINGSTKGAFIAYAEEDGVFTFCPIYNKSTTPDLLTSSTDPMGLQTELTYSLMSLPSVYQPRVEWDKYLAGPGQASYPVIQCAELVVSQIVMSNDASINAFPYRVDLQKQYYGATINTQGRGWEGFDIVTTTNQSASAQTREYFCKPWPLIGLRSQLDTLSNPNYSGGSTTFASTLQEGAVLRSQKTTYVPVSTCVNGWNIFHIDRTLETTDMYDNGNLSRSTGVSFAFDSSGNMTAQSPWEASVGNNVAEQRLWTKYSYTSLNTLSAIPAAKKVTSVESNEDMQNFQEGDLGLTLFNYDSTTSLLQDIQRWSDQNATFAVTTVGWDAYGNQIQITDPAQLATALEMDNFSYTYPVQATESGPGINLVSLTAFDQFSGNKVAIQSASGETSCIRYDAFGRNIQQVKNVPQNENGPSLQTASAFLQGTSLATNARFLGVLEDAIMAPFESTSYQQLTSAIGSNYLCKSKTLHAADGSEGITVQTELIDCAGKVRRKWIRNGSGNTVLQYFEYDAQNNLTLESTPTLVDNTVPESQLYEWMPLSLLSTTTVYDTLHRVVSRTHPSHGGSGTMIVTTHSYQNGGSLVESAIATVQNSTTATPLTPISLETQSRTVRSIAARDTVVKSVDASGLSSAFTYDPLGRMTASIDGGGKLETRSYNTGGKLTAMNNTYQNTSFVPGSNAIARQYDLANHLIAETNALGQTVTFQNDAKGRVLNKSALDGQASIFTYDTTGYECLVSVTNYSQGPTSTIESQYDFSYDVRGRQTTSQVTIPGSESFSTAITYDWQDNPTNQAMADGTATTRTYTGSLLSSTCLTGPAEEGWSLLTAYDQYSAFGTPVQWTVSGTGVLKSQFLNNIEYDCLGFPTSQSLTATSPLYARQYVYNDLDQLSTMIDTQSNARTDYTYTGRRLTSSTTSSGNISNYMYDGSGNLTVKNGMLLLYGADFVSGSQNGNQAIQVTYDQAGRAVNRTLPGSDTSFTYDSFGNMSQIQDVKTGVTTSIVTNHLGKTLVRTLSDGTREIDVGSNVIVKIAPDGSRTIRRKLIGADRVVGVVTSMYSSLTSLPPTDAPIADIYTHDSKGSVTNVFNGDGSLRQALVYDDFGALATLTSYVPSDTYESRQQDAATGLLDFGARWYDPVIGRFTTPDNIMTTKGYLRQDGMNRYAFENNDPINNIDPSGHWSLASVLGLVVGVIAVAASFAVDALPGGVLISGALMGAGINAVTYSLDHRNETNATTFVEGYLWTAAVGAVTGAVGGAAADWFKGASGVSKLAKGGKWLARATHLDNFEGAAGALARTMSVGGRAAVGLVGDVANQVDNNAIDDDLYGGHEKLTSGLNAGFFAEHFAENAGLAGGKDLLDHFKIKESVLKPATTRAKNVLGIKTSQDPLDYDDNDEGFVKAVTGYGYGVGIAWKNPFDSLAT